MKTKIFNYIRTLGIEKCGVAQTDEGESAIVCLFPYFSGYHNGNLSVYAYMRDYHIIIREKLEKIAGFIKSLDESIQCECFVDIGPNIDRKLAYRAGLGFYGKNNMLINSDLGSYFFIGYVRASLKLEADLPLEQNCMNCGKCIESCPGNALENGFCISRCASHISQKKGELTIEEKEILKKTGLVFGCDTCQKVCPHNDGKINAMSEFKKDLMFNIDIEDIKNISGKEFMRKYKDRAFSWRGRSVILRNLEIL